MQDLVQLQKFVKNHDQVMHRVMGFLHSVDAQRRSSQIAGFPNGMGVGSNEAAIDDHPASPLQQAAKLLEEYSVANLPNKELEQMTHDYHLRNDYSTPPNDPVGSSMAPPAEGSSSAHIGYPVSNDLDNMVYPVGHTNGIDPLNSEHMNNIPYSLPATMIPPDGVPEMLPQGSESSNPRKKAIMESVWGPTKPRILLVEDDKVCARIGSKFLQAFECGVEIAVSHRC